MFIWIWIFFALLGNACTEIKIAYACSCRNTQLECASSLIIVINSSYGVKTGKCGQGDNGCMDCCMQETDDCLVPYPNVSILNESCYLQTRCNIAYHEVNIRFGDCGQKKSDYLRVDYECVAGTSTTTKKIGTPENASGTIVTSNAPLPTDGITSSNKPSSTASASTSLNGADEQSKHLMIILVVVATVLVISAVVVAVFILHRGRCKKSTRDDASKYEVPTELINHDITSNRQSTHNYEIIVETPNYDEMNDKSIATHSIPARKEKDDSDIAKDEMKNGGNGTIEEYDRIQFEKKCAVKMPNYDSVSAIEVKKLDDTYYHASSQSNPASPPTTNEYSHGQFLRQESQSNDYTKKTTIPNEPCIADNYSHVDLDSDRTKRRQTNIVEKDSYIHIDLDKTTIRSRNGETVNVRTIHKSEEGSQTFKEDLQSLDAESEVWPIDNSNSGVSSKDPPLPDIKAASLPDKYIEFKIGGIYDTPVCKDQQPTVVLKGNNEHLFNSIDTGNKQKSATEENNGATKNFAIGSDYELAKLTDF